jgi:prepilin signal peptidase PulO-like enzyme (type II secretory pathway)
VLFGAAAYSFGISLGLLRALVLLGVLVILAGIDLEHGLLPNAVIGPAVVVGFVLSPLTDPSGWWVYPLSALVAVLGMGALAIAYPAGMGMGDVKMDGMLSAFLGPQAALAVFIGALAGAVIGIALMIAGKMGRRSPLPFGVFLAAGGVVSLFFGPWIWGAYLGMVGV